MIKQIVVPLDGSEFAERALPRADLLARETGAALALIRVVEVLAPGEREPGVISYLDEHRVAAAQDYIAGAARRSHATNVTAEAYIAADVPAGIIARALDVGADLIVMTTHGASWPSMEGLGSVAARLVREAPCPVVVIGPGVVSAVPAV
jgi:nucleotide-binding universal stress UspA family protein